MNSQPRLWIRELTFSDNSVLKFDLRDSVVIVGPNNSGKSACLRAIRSKIQNPASVSLVVNDIQISKLGSADDVIAWLNAIAKKNLQNPTNPSFTAFGATVHEQQARSAWSHGSALQELGRFFCHLLTADERLTAANPATTVALTRDPLHHPIHFLQRHDALEKEVSDRFRKAFGADLIVHRNAGNQVPLHVGNKPVPSDGEDRVSYEYTVRLEMLPSVETQGDGMRSFAGVLLHTTVGQESILLIDEPEAFLHPPQARMLGKMLVNGSKGDQQLFVSTHSGDILRGILDGDSGNVRVLRIRREGDENIVRLLDNEHVKQLWTDPLLRFSNVLDGVFHERVIVAESDGDARFYCAVADALYDGPLAEQQKPDVMFVHCGGKDRLPMVVRSLRALEVPVVAVADFDLLNSESPLSDLVEAAGGKWDNLKSHWNSVKNAIDAIRPQLSTDDVKTQIEAVLAGVAEPMFPRDANAQIKKILKQTSPWALAKRVGKKIVPSGTPTQEYMILINQLRELGIFLVEVGELEGFCTSIGGHGPSWVNQVLTMNLCGAPELKDAREFVSGLLE